MGMRSLKECGEWNLQTPTSMDLAIAATSCRLTRTQHTPNTSSPREARVGKLPRRKVGQGREEGRTVWSRASQERVDASNGVAHAPSCSRKGGVRVTRFVVAGSMALDDSR